MYFTLSPKATEPDQEEKKMIDYASRYLLVADSLAQSLQINYDATHLQRSKAFYSG